MFSPSMQRTIVDAFGAQTRKCTPPPGCTSAPIGMERFGAMRGAEAADINQFRGSRTHSAKAANGHTHQWSSGGLVPREGLPAFRLLHVFAAITARGRRLNDDGFAGIQHSGVASLQRFGRPIFTTYGIRARLSGFTAGYSEWPHATMAGQQGAFHPLKKTDRSFHTIAGFPASLAARVRAYV